GEFCRSGRTPLRLSRLDRPDHHRATWRQGRRWPAHRIPRAEGDAPGPPRGDRRARARGAGLPCRTGRRLPLARVRRPSPDPAGLTGASGEAFPMTFLVAADQALLIARRASQWSVEEHLRGHSPECVAVDPINPSRVYCGTWGRGVWRSDDAGGKWEPVGAGIAH